MSKCPLCDSPQLKELEIIPAETIVRGYSQHYAMDVSPLFQGVDRLVYYECCTCSLRSFRPTVAGGADFYAALQKHPWYYRPQKAEYEIARALLGKKCTRVLDIGCGLGDFANYDSGQYVGLELNESAVSAARAKGRDVRCETIQEHARAHPEGYDAVVSFQVLEHVTSPREIIEASLLTLKPRGKMVICVPNDESFVGYRKNSILNSPPHHISRWCPSTLDWIASRYKLQLIGIEFEPLGNEHTSEYLATEMEGLLAGEMKRTPIFEAGIGRYLKDRLIRTILRCRKGYRSKIARPVGHSMIGIYQK
jgi:SAM-dependent methyltransferase